MGSSLKAVILCFLILSVITKPTKSDAEPDCAGVSADLHVCAGFIRNPIGPPPSACCDALRRIESAEATLGIPKTCQCIKSCDADHLDDQLDANVWASLLVGCGNINLGFDLSTNDVC